MSIRFRSGSVERRVTSSSTRDPAPYRTSYGTERGRTRDLPPSGTRMSRATSYDPFATSSRSNSVIRTSALSNSDYTPRNVSLSYNSRYGSTEQLNSYRPSYRSGSMTSSSSGATSSSSYTPRNVRAGSVSIGAYDPPNRSDAFTSSSLSRYRPPDTTPSYTSNLSRYRSTDLSTTSDYSSSKYTSSSSSSSGRYSAYSSRNSTNTSFRSDRDYRSMSRGTEASDVDDVEQTFRKLCRKYVTAESVPDLTKNYRDKTGDSLAEKVSRRFESKSEAEDDDFSISEEDEDEILTKYQSKGLRRASSTSSITPRASVCNSPSKDLTPKCSPLPSRKEFHDKSRSKSPEIANVKPLTRSYQMEVKFDEEYGKSDNIAGDVHQNTSEAVEASQKTSEIVKPAWRMSNNVETSHKTLESVKSDWKKSDGVESRQKTPEDVKIDVSSPELLENHRETSPATQKTSEMVKIDRKQSDDVESRQKTPDAVKVDVSSSELFKNRRESSPAIQKTSESVKFDWKRVDDVEIGQKTPEERPAIQKTSESVKIDWKTSDDVKIRQKTPEAVKIDVKTSELLENRRESSQTTEKTSETVKIDSKPSDDVKSSQKTPESVKIDVNTSEERPEIQKTSESVKIDWKNADNVDIRQKTSESVKFEWKESDDVKISQKTPEDVKVDVSSPEVLENRRESSPTIQKTSESVKSDVEPSEDAKPSEVVKKVAASIKINGIAVEKEKTSEIEDSEGLIEKIPVRIRIRSEKSAVVLHSESPEKTSDSREKSTESEDTTSSSRGSSLRKRRDPNRTLENLKSILMDQKMEKNEENPMEKKIRRIPIPLVLITEPSNPSTPLATTPVTTAASICLWNPRTSSEDDEEEEEDEDEEYEDEEDEFSSGDWTEGEDDEEYLTDEDDGAEFSVSQTFSLKDHIDLKELYPLTNSPSGASALVSEFCGSTDFNPEDVAARKEESRGRVDSLFAIPAPTFTCSVTYDGQADDDVDEWSDEVHSCEEGDDDDFRVLPIIRPGSSSLAAYLSPGSISSEENSEDGESEEKSEYDGTTVGCTLKLVDRAARKDSEESDDSEYYDDEEEEIDDEDYEDEEYWDEEIEYEDEEEEELEYYEDEEEDVEEEEGELFVAPPIRLMTESLVEEMIEEACYGEIPEETLFALDGIEVEDYIGHKDVQMIPTFVRQMTENIREESASRFAADRKPATDFARKAVIQPTKLEKVQIGTKIDTKVAPSEEEKRKQKLEEELEKKRKKEMEEAVRKIGTKIDTKMAPSEDEKRKKKLEEELEKKRKKEMEEAVRKQQEDKSALRKSALNMKDEDAKKKVANDEKTAAQKARRFGTVSAMAGKFDEKDEGVTYKKSSRLLEHVEKPKRTYEVIKPVINDDFDKQMEEIRKQMKSGSNELQNKMKMLSKGILTVTEEAKSRDMEEKRRVTVEKATGAIGKAEQEKARWKASRDAETAAEYAKIEAEKHLKKKRILIDNPSGETVLNQEKVEPKRTIRKWKPPPPDPNAIIPSFSCGPKEPVKPKIKSPTVTQKDTVAVAAVVPKAEGAAATRIRNAAIGTVDGTVIPAGPDTKTPMRKYNARRKTQEIVNESAVKPKTKNRKEKARKRRFVRQDRDSDAMLGFQKNATFEQLERFFELASRNRRPITQKLEKIRRLAPSKLFISDLTDIDKIYKSSEIRDIIASVNLVY